MAPATSTGGRYAGELPTDYAPAEVCVASIFDKDYQKSDKIWNSLASLIPQGYKISP